MENPQQMLAELQIDLFIAPAIIITASAILGYIFQKIVVAQIKRVSKHTKWEGDDIVIDGLGKAPLLWFILAGIYTTLVDLPLDAEYEKLLWQVMLVIFVLSVAAVGSQIAIGFIHSYSNKNTQTIGSTSMFNILTKVTIFAFAILVILQTLGISITPLLTALGVGGLAVALALQETLSNLFAGLHILASKKLKPGDYIELDSGQTGTVQDISWRNTTLRTIGNNLVIVPNSNVASAIIINYAGPEKEMSLIVPVGVSYGSDLEKVEKVVVDVATEILKKEEGAVPDYEPKVRFNEFGASSINLSAILRIQEFTNQYLIRHEFMKALHKRFQKEGIEIPFPQMDVHLSKEK